MIFTHMRKQVAASGIPEAAVFMEARGRCGEHLREAVVLYNIEGAIPNSFLKV